MQAEAHAEEGAGAPQEVQLVAQPVAQQEMQQGEQWELSPKG